MKAFSWNFDFIKEEILFFIIQRIINSDQSFELGQILRTQKK